MAVKKEKVTGYIRVSTGPQAEGESLPEQREQITKHCDKSEYDLVEIYEDIMSGSSTERPSLQKMIGDGRNEKFSKIVFYKMSRFGRNARDLLNLFNYFEEEMQPPIYLESIKEKFDTSTAVGRLLRTVLAAVVEFDRETINEQFQGARRRKRDRGEYAGGRILYGYKIEYDLDEKGKAIKGSAKIVQDKEAVEILHRIRDDILYLGYPLSRVAGGLIKDKILTPSGKGTWWDTTISKILYNDGLFGDFTFNKVQFEMVEGKPVRKEDRPEEEWKKIPNPCPIFTKKEIEKIRAAITSREKRGPRQKIPGKWLLKGILRCALCGSTASNDRSRMSKKTGERIYYYNCYWGRANESKRKRANKNKCAVPHLNADKTDQYVWDFIVKKIAFSDPKVLEQYLDITSIRGKEKRLEKSLEQQKNKRKSIEGKIETLYDRLESRKYNEKKLHERINKREEEHKILQEKIGAQEEELQKIKNSVDAIKKYKKEWMKLISDRAEAKEKLHALPFEQKQALLRHVFQNGKLSMYPITMEKAEDRTPPDENCETYGMFFGQGKKVGVDVRIDTIIEPYEILNILQSLLEKNDIQIPVNNYHNI